MNYLDFEKLGYYDLKSQLNDYIHTRLKEIEANKDKTEYDFCTTRGRIEELQALFNFFSSNKKSSELKDLEDSHKSNT